MAHLPESPDEILMLALAIPMAVVAAAVALRLACLCSSVEPPSFWQAVSCIVVVGVINILFQVCVGAAGIPTGVMNQIVAPIVLSAVGIAICFQTGFCSALLITGFQALICSAGYVGFLVLGDVCGITLS